MLFAVTPFSRILLLFNSINIIYTISFLDEEADQLKELEELKADHEKVCKELETAVAAARKFLIYLYFHLLLLFIYRVDLFFCLEKRLALVRDALMVISTDRLASN